LQMRRMPHDEDSAFRIKLHTTPSRLGDWREP
jgi:hypothetical protein